MKKTYFRLLSLFFLSLISSCSVSRVKKINIIEKIDQYIYENEISEKDSYIEIDFNKKELGYTYAIMNSRYDLCYPKKEFYSKNFLYKNFEIIIIDKNNVLSKRDYKLLLKKFQKIDSKNLICNGVGQNLEIVYAYDQNDKLTDKKNIYYDSSLLNLIINQEKELKLYDPKERKFIKNEAILIPKIYMDRRSTQ